ncbi:MAG: fatty-acyl-CoA synthase [Acidimicrobiales bacterium]|jgi:fatty-acyl-CoA synthase
MGRYHRGRGMSLLDWIRPWADTDRIAFHFEGDAVSYTELVERVQATALGLVAMGVEPGDRVGYCGLNRIEVFDLLFASSHLGAIFVPFNNRMTAAEIRQQAADCTPSVMFTTDGFGALVAETGSAWLVRDLDVDPFQRAGGVAAPAGAAGPEATVLMVYTSGTTGQAKGAMLSENAMHYAVLNGIDHQGLTAEDCTIAPLPTFHVGGLNIQTLPTLYVGGQVVLQRRFDPAGVLALVAEHKATQTLLVPAMLAAVASQPNFASTDLSSLRGINSGSSIVPAEVMQPFFERGIPVGQVYGTTETGPTAVVLGYGEAADNVGSCGKPAAHTELRLVDAHGVDVADGEPGELWLRGPNIFTGYWGNAQATDEAFAAGRWFRTGDVGYRSAAGFVYISDRIKDVVISGGENVYPAELELILAEHPAISEVAVIGVKDDRWGEVPVAVVVLDDGAMLELADLREWCETRLARFKQPRGLRVVDGLPRTALGKVKKHDLRSAS